jgi:glycosyltransferase involved in cell wall biosynthesis
MKFSACWIVKNEEDNIEKSIESVKEVADELIVVDTGSTDGTVRAAKQTGARVAHFDWVKDFSAARNYALSLASGEFVIFLDADEYFDPPLTETDGESLLTVFDETEADILRIHSLEIEKETGFVCGVRIRPRLLRREALHYEGRIHEIPVLADGGNPVSSLLRNYKMVHTGSSRSDIPQKIKRNQQIVEDEQKSIEEPLSRYLNAIYMMQDAFFSGDVYKAADYCMYLLAHHEHHADAHNAFPAECKKFFYNAIHIVELNRNEFSRKEVYAKLFKVIKERYANGRDGILAELHYQLRFDYRDDRFQRELENALPKLHMDLPVGLPDCRLIEAKIFGQAAEASHMRGDKDKTCLYACRALESMPDLDERPLLLLLHALGNRTLKDTESVLKSHPGIADKVIKILNTEGERERLLTNANSPSVFPPETRYAPEPGCVSSFRTRAEKLYASMRYADITRDPDASFAAERDYICAYYVAYGYLMQKEYGSAYEIVTPHLSKGIMNQALLSVLLVAAEKLPQPTAMEARRRYEESMAIINELIDLQDVINTGTVYAAAPEKEKRALKEMTASAFLDGYKRDKGRPATDLLLETYKKAAPVFEQKGCVLMAAESYRLLLAKRREPDKNTRLIKRLFNDNGNPALAWQAEILTL